MEQFELDIIEKDIFSDKCEQGGCYHCILCGSPDYINPELHHCKLGCLYLKLRVYVNWKKENDKKTIC